MADERSDHPQRPGDKVFDDLGWGGGPEFIERDLTALFSFYASDPKTLYAAFESLERICQHWWDDEVAAERPDPQFGLPPLSCVPVPWWIVHLLGKAWMNYKPAPQGTTIGEALGLEGGGQGKRPQRQLFETKLRDMNLALEVAHRIESVADEGQRESVEKAIAEVAEQFGHKERRVRAAWDKEKGTVRKSLVRFHEQTEGES